VTPLAPPPPCTPPQYTPAFCEREKIYIKAYLWSHDVNVAVILGHQRRLREEVRGSGVRETIDAPF